MSSTPRIAVIGAGNWGRNHVRVWAELGVLATVADPDPARLAEIEASYPGISTHGHPEAAIEAADAVVIASPAVEHGPTALAALEAGKDVLVEKPMATDLAVAEQMAALASDRGLILAVGHVLEYHPAARALKRLVDGGDLGRIRYLYSNRLNFGTLRTVEDAMWSFAPHDISLLLRIVGREPLHVGCAGGSYVSSGIADVTVMHLTFPDEVRAHVHVSWLHPFKEQRFVVIGDRQMAVFDDLAPWDEKLTLYPHSVEWVDGTVPVARKAERRTIDVPPGEPLRLECEAFLDAITSRVPPLADAASGLGVLRVLKAGEESLRSNADMVASQSTAYIHPSSVVDDGARIGDGTHVWHFCHISSGATIGRDCVLGQNVFVGRNVSVGDGVKIQNNVSVYEGVELDDHVFCGPSVVFTNVANPRAEVERKDEFRRTRVARGATIGANSTIVCGVTLGEYAFVAAGAVVTDDVAPYALVMGVPARRAGWMCRCGERLPSGEAVLLCPACGRTYVASGSDALHLGTEPEHSVS